MSTWAKENAVSIVGWLIALIAAAYIGGSQVSAITNRLTRVESEQVRSRNNYERLDRITARLEAIVERLEK